jgi:hypothetical protein
MTKRKKKQKQKPEKEIIMADIWIRERKKEHKK